MSNPIWYYICHLALSIVLPVFPHPYSSNVCISVVLCHNNIPKMRGKGCLVPGAVNKATLYGPHGDWPCQAMSR